MGYTTSSNCPRCGAPIYVESPYWSTLPPAPIRSCACFPQPFSCTISTSTTGIISPSQIISVTSKENK